MRRALPLALALFVALPDVAIAVLDSGIQWDDRNATDRLPGGELAQPGAQAAHPGAAAQ